MNYLPVIILGGVAIAAAVASYFHARTLIRRAKDMPNRHGK